MKQKYVQFYMNVALQAASLSHARKLKVGAVVVNDDTFVFGYNGMPSGWGNNCEHELTELRSEYGEGTRLFNTGELKTRPEVLHAESNAISKLARSVVNGKDAVIFVTHAPCMDCAKLIYQSGIRELYYLNDYRSTAGLDFLAQCGVQITRVEEQV
jgi:dCMP deaminase